MLLPQRVYFLSLLFLCCCFLRKEQLWQEARQHVLKAGMSKEFGPSGKLCIHFVVRSAGQLACLQCMLCVSSLHTKNKQDFCQNGLAQVKITTNKGRTKVRYPQERQCLCVFTDNLIKLEAKLQVSTTFQKIKAVATQEISVSVQSQILHTNQIFFITDSHSFKALKRD